MGDRSAVTQAEIDARRQLVELAEAMLIGQISFLEGAPQVVALQYRVGGCESRDEDFDAFVLISSETDHLPTARARHLWSASALERVEPDIQRAEEWAQAFAPQACESLLSRFRTHDS